MVEVMSPTSTEGILVTEVRRSFEMAAISYLRQDFASSAGVPIRAISAKASESDLLVRKITDWIESGNSRSVPALRSSGTRGLRVLVALIQEFRKTSFELPCPLAAPGEDSGFMLSWDSGEHHLEVEFDESPVARWFYWKRGSDVTWESEVIEPPGFDEGALARLELLRSAAL